MIRETLATFTTVEKTQDEVAALIAKGTCLVAEEASGVLGFASYGPFRPSPGYAATVEHTVILSPEAQGRGVGRALIDGLCAQAAADGKHIMVAAISSANPGAVAFHAALGFEQTALMPQVGRKQGQWLDLILMQKTLSLP